MTDDVTLQINLSAGDIAYAERVVTELSASHSAAVGHRLAVVDLCKPQKTKINDPAARWPGNVFEERVERITEIAEQLRARGVLDDVVFLRPGDPIFEHLSDRYLDGVVRETHDYGGCALMSYFAALDVPTTRYVAHYDGDMLLYQAPGYDWTLEAREHMRATPEVVAATPRISPPFARQLGLPDGPSRHEELPYKPSRGGWTNSWYSTRCFMVDRERLTEYLPLVRGKLLLETLAVRYLRRGYPRSPEIMLHRAVGLRGGPRLTLSSEQAWLLHPLSKPPEYLELLPGIMAAVRDGRVPDAQRGMAEIDVAAWRSYLMCPAER